MILALILLAQGIAGYGSIQLPPPPQQVTAGHRDFVSIRDFNAPCDGVNDDVPALTSAISNRLPASGGTVDARGCALLTIGTTLTISKAAVTILLPAATISMGANQIIVPVGVHNVALIGAVPYGGSASNLAAGSGTFLAYTGSSIPILVGDSTGDTYGFRMVDVSLGLSTAGNTATGIQLNRAIDCMIERDRFHSPFSNNLQTAIDLEGGVNFTGCHIADAYVWNSSIGITFGAAANATTVTGMYFVNSSTLGGTCFNFAGATGNPAVGNQIFGGDCEPGIGGVGTALKFDFATKNEVFGLRNESTPTFVNATINSFGNFVFGANSSGTITDSGINTVIPNSFNTVNNASFNNTNWVLHNRSDATSLIDLWAGATTGQTINLNMRKWDASISWVMRKDAAELLQFVGPGSAVRFRMDPGAGTFLNAEGSTSIFFNQQAGVNASTGGVSFGSGGASPTQVAAINNVGALVQTGVVFANLGTPSNGRIIYCSDCTIANPCAGAGTGAFAKRLNGVWVCN